MKEKPKKFDRLKRQLQKEVQEGAVSLSLFKSLDRYFRILERLNRRYK